MSVKECPKSKQRLAVWGRGHGDRVGKERGRDYGHVEVGRT